MGLFHNVFVCPFSSMRMEVSTARLHSVHLVICVRASRRDDSVDIFPKCVERVLGLDEFLPAQGLRKASVMCGMKTSLRVGAATSAGTEGAIGCGCNRSTLRRGSSCSAVGEERRRAKILTSRDPDELWMANASSDGGRVVAGRLCIAAADESRCEPMGQLAPATTAWRRRYPLGILIRC